MSSEFADLNPRDYAQPVYSKVSCWGLSRSNRSTTLISLFLLMQRTP